MDQWKTFRLATKNPNNVVTTAVRLDAIVSFMPNPMPSQLTDPQGQPIVKLGTVLNVMGVQIGIMEHPSEVAEVLKLTVNLKGPKDAKVKSKSGAGGSLSVSHDEPPADNGPTTVPIRDQ
jgi:hypothetical protein